MRDVMEGRMRTLDPEDRETDWWTFLGQYLSVMFVLALFPAAFMLGGYLGTVLGALA